jgi:hypothetical protein
MADTKKLRIVLTRRSSDYSASIEGEPKLWECAQNEREAIESLARRFPDLHGAEIVFAFEWDGRR